MSDLSEFETLVRKMRELGVREAFGITLFSPEEKPGDDFGVPSALAEIQRHGTSPAPPPEEDEPKPTETRVSVPGKGDEPNKTYVSARDQRGFPASYSKTYAKNGLEIKVFEGGLTVVKLAEYDPQGSTSFTFEFSLGQAVSLFGAVLAELREHDGYPVNDADDVPDLEGLVRAGGP